MTAPEFSDAEMIAEMIARSESSESLARAAGIMGEGNGWPATKAHAERLVLLYRAIAARLTAASGDWQPPEEAERPDGFRCQGWVMGQWEPVKWHAVTGYWANHTGDLQRHPPTAFAPLPPTPTKEVTK